MLREATVLTARRKYNERTCTSCVWARLVTSTAEFVISLRDRLEWLSGKAADNPRSTQEKQKAY